MARIVKFPDSNGFFHADACLESALSQKVSLSSFDVQVANLALSVSSEIWEVPRSSIIDYGRKKEFVNGRYLFASATLAKTGLPYRCIGGFLSGRDHSTIGHMCEMHEYWLVSRDEWFDKYKSASIIMDECMKKVTQGALPEEVFQVVTNKKRLADLKRFLRILGKRQVTDEIVMNYISDNPII